MKKVETREIMINSNGKPLFAVRIDNGESNDANYVYIQNGDIKFSSSWLSSIVPYSLSNESHRLAKEIFTIGLQAAVKTKVYELKQLESILTDINLGDCLGNVLIDNTKLLLEVNDNINRKTQTVIDVTENQIKKVVKSTDKKVDEVVEEVRRKSVSREDVKEVVETAIIDTVKPIAVKKKAKE